MVAALLALAGVFSVGAAGFYSLGHMYLGPNAWPLGKMEALLETLAALDRSVKQHGLLETSS